MVCVPLPEFVRICHLRLVSRVVDIWRTLVADEMQLSISVICPVSKIHAGSEVVQSTAQTRTVTRWENDKV
jgi:hypothetical protein